MPATLTALRREIAHEERVVGIPTDQPLTNAAIGRRHLQLGLLLGLVAIATVATLASDHTVLRLSTVAGAFAFGLYALQKEGHLQRLESLQRDERSIDLTVADGLLRSGFISADREYLELRNAVERGAPGIATGLAAVVPADCARLRLVGPSGETPLAAVSDVTGALLYNVSVAPEVVRWGTPVRRDGLDGRTILGVPLAHRDGVVGVLEVISGPDARYSAHDEALVSAYARGAISGLLTRRPSPSAT